MDGDILRNLRVFAVPDETQHSLEGGVEDGQV